MTEANKKYRFETLQLHVGPGAGRPGHRRPRSAHLSRPPAYVFHNADHAAARFGLARRRRYLRLG